MTRERRQPTKAELARVTSSRPVVLKILPAGRKDFSCSPKPEGGRFRSDPKKGSEVT